MRNIIWSTRLLAAAFLLSMLAGCGGASTPIIPNGLHTNLETALTPLDTLAAPADVSPAVWAELKAALRMTLAMHGAAQVVAGVPAGVYGQVGTLELTVTTGFDAELSWRYHNLGDYDQNGEVGISDLVPVGRYFGVGADSSRWAQAQVADGNCDGVIGISDVTPIGANFGSVVDGYLVQQALSALADAPWSDIAQVPFIDATAGVVDDWRRFQHSVSQPVNGSRFRVLPYYLLTDGALGLGEASAATLFGYGDWLTVAHDASRRGCSPFVGPERADVRWELPGTFSEPLIGPDGNLRLIKYGDLEPHPDGSSRWLVQINPDGDELARNTLSDDANTLFALTADGDYYCQLGYDTVAMYGADGQERWHYTIDESSMSTPVLGSDGAIYFGTFYGPFYALASDGTYRWSIEADHTHSTPAIHPAGMVLFTSLNGIVHALDFDGTPVWSYDAVYYSFTTPVVDSADIAYIGTSAGTLLALNPDGTLKWTFVGDGDMSERVAIGPDGTIYARTVSNAVPPPPLDYYRLYAISPDGTLKWTFEPGVQLGKPIVDGAGHVYIGSTQGALYALNPDGSALWSYKADTHISSGVIGPDGTLYATGENLLLAFGPSGPPAPPSAPFGLNASDGEFGDRVELSWGEVEGANAYFIYRDTQEQYISSAVRPCWTDHTLTDWDAHTYWVRAVGNHGWSSFSLSDTGELQRQVGDPVPGDWRMEGHDAQRTYRTSIEGPRQATLKWVVPFPPLHIGGDAHSAPVISSTGTLYAPGYDLHAYWPEGTLKWTYFGPIGVIAPWPGFDGSPALRTDGVVCASGDGLYAINPDGTRRWYYGGVDGVPAIAPDGLSCVCTDFESVCTVNADGSLAWELELEDFWLSAPALAPGGTIYVGGESGTLYAIAPGGELAWTHSFNDHAPEVQGPVQAVCVRGDSTILAISDDVYEDEPYSIACDGLYAVNPDGTRLWSCPFGHDCSTPPAIATDGTAYVGCDDGMLLKITPAGAIAWENDTRGQILAAPSIGADEVIYVPVSNIETWPPTGATHAVFALSPARAFIESFPVDGEIRASPVLGDDGTLYIMADNNMLYAYSR